MDLTLYHAEISQVLQIIHHLFNIEGAVFDDSAVLVTGSKGYLERKGTAVHKPSIMEVIENDEVIVLRPGEMRSCIGCRFSGNCPATLELLKRIVIDGTPVGVLSFSAFSESAHDRIAEQMDYFERIMVDFSDLLAMLIKNAHAGDASVFEKQFAALTSLVSEGLLVTNARGEITASNAPALAMLSGSCLTSIHDFLPPELSAEVLSPQPVQNRSVSLRPDCELTITSVPILGADGSSEGAALRLSAKSGPILPPTRHVDASRMRGSGTQMASVRRRMNKILSSPSSVYISGETGTGKGLLARAIHYESNRRDKPFVIISCANIPETLFESELFGYEGGAFTGALKSGKQGKMELAEGGTLFLDEISEMPMSMQAKLLTVLQDRQFERVGGTRPIPLNTRIISASNADIRQRIAEGASAPTSSTGSTSSTWRCARCASVWRTYRNCSTHFCRSSTTSSAPLSRASATKCSRCSAATAGPATSASSKTSSNTASTWPKAASSSPMTCRPRSCASSNSSPCPPSRKPKAASSATY